MGKTLIIAEKPSVARDIASAIGGFSQKEKWLESDTMLVSSGIGHLVEVFVPDASTTGKNLATLPVIAPFATRPIEKTKSQLVLLGKLMKRDDVDCIVNACDAGREGELIFRLIYEHQKCKKPMKRMWLQSMTKDAILEAFKTMRPGSDFDRLSDAAKCRSEADWMVGINGSRGISELRKIQTGRYEVLSAGRVQTPTLAILVHLEQQIQSFVPKPFWEVHGSFTTPDGTYVGKWIPKGDGDQEGQRFWDRSQADALVSKCKGKNPESVTESSKPSNSLPPKLFDLTTLQREANKRFKFSAKKTLDIAQALYEKHKATTYPRTDSQALPEDYVGKATQVLGSLRDPNYHPHADRVIQNNWVKKDKRIFDNSKISDHFAIIPTGKSVSGLSPDEEKIYDMVVRRFIAVFHPAAEYQVTTRTTTVEGETFQSRGKVLVEPGWLQVYGQQSAESDDEPSLVPVKDPSKVTTTSIDLASFETKPPARLTEATLLSAMEKAGKLIDDEELADAMSERGLGTPATRAQIIEGLLSTKGPKGTKKEPYIERVGKAQHLVPTAKGMDLITWLDGQGIDSLTSPKMTGEWEAQLAEIEKGKGSRSTFMSGIGTMTRDLIQKIRTQAATLPGGAMKPLKVSCPSCGGEVHSSASQVECKASCGMKIWREVARRKLSDDEIETLLQSGSTPVLEGFKSKTGSSFTARLKLAKDFKLEFEFDANGGGGTAGKPVDIPCPKCSGTLQHYEGAKGKVACGNGDFTMWTTIAGKTLKESEWKALLKNKELPKTGGFISSKTGKAFDAALKLQKDGKVDFVFEPRK